jgi:hypothetical protein
METELLPENAKEFLERFVHGYDGVIGGFTYEAKFERQGRRYDNLILEIVLELLDREVDSRWSRVTLFVEGFVELKIYHRTSELLTLSDGVRIGFFDQQVHLAFDQWMEDDYDTEYFKTHFKKAAFYVSAERCFWSSIELK